MSVYINDPFPAHHTKSATGQVARAARKAMVSGALAGYEPALRAVRPTTAMWMVKVVPGLRRSSARPSSTSSASSLLAGQGRLADFDCKHRDM